MRIFLLSCLLIALPASQGTAAEGSDFSVKAEVDKASVTIGERIAYRVTVTRDPSIQILSQLVPPPSDVFEMKEAHDFSEKQGKQIVEGRRFIFTTYELGEFILEPVTIRYRTTEGKEKQAATNRLYITVRSVDSSGKEKTDIRDVKGVLELRPRWAWLWGSLLLSLLVAGGAFFWWRWRHRALLEQKLDQPVLSLEDETLLRLNRLFDSDLLRRGKVKEYFLELSEIIRRYFEGRFEIQAVESTTLEVLRDLKEKEIPQPLWEKIQQILETADLAKFAKWKPAAPEILRLNQLTKTMIEEARPNVGV